jgi:hypothetical protein
MSWAAFGGATLDFLKKIPGWVWLVLAGLAVGWAYVEQEKSRAVDRDRDRTRTKQAKVKTAVVERVSDITEQEQANATEALEARDAGVHYPSADSMPDDLRSIGIRNPRGS